MGQRDMRHEVKQKNGSLAKLVRQQTATLSSSVRVLSGARKMDLIDFSKQNLLNPFFCALGN